MLANRMVPFCKTWLDLCQKVKVFFYPKTIFSCSTNRLNGDWIFVELQWHGISIENSHLNFEIKITGRLLFPLYNILFCHICNITWLFLPIKTCKMNERQQFSCKLYKSPFISFIKLIFVYFGLNCDLLDLRSHVKHHILAFSFNNQSNIHFSIFFCCSV